MTSCVSRWFCPGIHSPWYLLNKPMPKTAIFARNYLFQTIVLGIHLSKFKSGRIDFRRATNRSWVYCPSLLEFQNIQPITERLSNAFEDAFGILKDEDQRTEWMKHIHSYNNHKMTIYMTNDLKVKCLFTEKHTQQTRITRPSGNCDCKRAGTCKEQGLQ